MKDFAVSSPQLLLNQAPISVLLLADDPVTVPSARIGSIPVLATFVEGECVHGAERIEGRTTGPLPGGDSLAS